MVIVCSVLMTVKWWKRIFILVYYRCLTFICMEESLIEFLVVHKRIFLTFHILGVIVGMGGATITDILFFNFLRDFTISKKEAEVMRVISNIIMLALGLLILTGIALFLSDIPRYSSSAPFLSKSLIVVVISINGILMHKFIAPHMVKLSFLRHPFSTGHAMHKLRKISFGMGAVSFVSWYSVFFIAMLKSYIPETASILQIMLVYGAVLLPAVLVSQMMHHQLHRRSHPIL